MGLHSGGVLRATHGVYAHNTECNVRGRKAGTACRCNVYVVAGWLPERKQISYFKLSRNVRWIVQRSLDPA